MRSSGDSDRLRHSSSSAYNPWRIFAHILPVYRFIEWHGWLALHQCRSRRPIRNRCRKIRDDDEPNRCYTTSNTESVRRCRLSQPVLLRFGYTFFVLICLDISLVYVRCVKVCMLFYYLCFSAKLCKWIVNWLRCICIVAIIYIYIVLVSCCFPDSIDNKK